VFGTPEHSGTAVVEWGDAFRSRLGGGSVRGLGDFRSTRLGRDHQVVPTAGPPGREHANRRDGMAGKSRRAGTWLRTFVRVPARKTTSGAVAGVS